PPLSDLHSFPTRRSSDLDQRNVEACHWLNLPGPDAEQILLAQARLHQPADLIRPHGQHIDAPRSLAITDPLIAEVPIEGLVDDQDRKSTRLNSSHSQISY